MSTTSTAIAKANPTSMISQYRAEFELVLPANFRPETFVRLAQGALRRSDKLRQAAENNPGALMFALLDAARLGHEPGTDEYWLTPRKRKGQLEVLGIEGYKGITKRMMQHPKVLSVVAELVYEADQFIWNPGKIDDHQPPRWEGPQVQPLHIVDDWFTDRGEARGAYAYAILAGGSVSKVVVVGPKEIKRAQDASESASGNYSPWRRDRDAMIRKTALRRLEPYVPKATEMVAELRDRTAAAGEIADKRELPELPPVGVDPDTGETDPRDEDVVEAELVNGEPDYDDNPGFGEDQ